jgi:hypothetical protein
MRMLALFALLAFGSGVNAQACRVLDPELLRAYSGPCVNGFAEGEGTASGVAEYRGGFKAGRKHGYGVKTWPNGDRYEGGFAADAKDGYGSYQWGRGPWEGERYDGSFAGDRRQGYGIYWWPSGDAYAGPWEGDQPTGPGTQMMHARGKFAAEAQAAVARQGQKVCRAMPVGIGGRDWVRGMVITATPEGVAVRIDDAGKQPPHWSGGVELKPGAVVVDAPTAWTPCW